MAAWVFSVQVTLGIRTEACERLWWW